MVKPIVNQLVDQFAVNLFAGDRPFPNRFRLAAAATWAGISVASSLAALVCFVPLSQAQERQPSASTPTQIELSPASAISDSQGVLAPESLTPVFAPSSNVHSDAIGQDSIRQDSTGQDSIRQDSIGQIDTQRPVLPFSDVPPDHWAYEALLYLSTGGRSPRPVP